VQLFTKQNEVSFETGPHWFFGKLLDTGIVCMEDIEQGLLLTGCRSQVSIVVSQNVQVNLFSMVREKNATNDDDDDENNNNGVLQSMNNLLNRIRKQ
jgi:hypothetical protein